MLFSRVYLDICCLKRPFDDQTQLRIRLESEAVLWVLKQAESGELSLVSSEVLELENAGNTNQQRRDRVEELLRRMPVSVRLATSIGSRADELSEMGFHPLDALHIACAEEAGADVLVSCDDQLLNAARRNRADLGIAVVSPLDLIRSDSDE